MNERIKQLAETALEYAEKNQSADIPQHWFRLYNEKFAELIVLECMHECLRMQLGNQYTPEEMLFQTKYRKIIKEHFGVSNE